MCLATVSLVVLLSSSFGTTAVDASKTKNKALLQEKYGIDCGSHCTNAVVRLHEAKIEQEKCVVVVTGGFLLFSLESDLMMRDRRDFDLFLSRKKVSLRSLSPSLSRGETSPAVLVAWSFFRSLFSLATSNENDTHASRIPCPFFFQNTPQAIKPRQSGALWRARRSGGEAIFNRTSGGGFERIDKLREVAHVRD